MAIVGIVGFDDRTLGSGWLVASYPLPNMGGSEDTQYSFVCDRGVYVGSWAFIASKDPDGVDCTAIALLSGTNANNTAHHATYGPPIEGVLPEDLTLDRTGTWHWGCSIWASASYATAGRAIAVIGDTAIPANTKPIYGYGMAAVTYPDVYPFFHAVAAYVEFTIDWDAKVVYGYVNGKLCGSLAFTGTPICQVGNISKNGYTVGGQVWGGGSTSSPANVPQVTHIYLAVNPKGDPNPTPRLGSCRVRTAPLKTTLAGDAKTVGALDANGVINQIRVSPSTNNWTNYIQLPSGTTQMEVKPAGVVIPNTEQILAARWGLVNYKPADQSAGLTALLGDGTNMSPPYKRVGDLYGVDLSKYMPVAPDGGVWTQAKLNSFTFRLGSYEL